MMTRKQFAKALEEIRHIRSFSHGDIKIDDYPVYQILISEITVELQRANYAEGRQGKYKTYTYEDFLSLQNFEDRVTFSITLYGMNRFEHHALNTYNLAEE